MRAPDLVVVGGPSLDTVRAGGRQQRLVGGAGFITAVAARAQGARVGLVARVPFTLPETVARAFRPGGLEVGGLRALDGELTGFHIDYDAAGIATYTATEPGLEAGMTADDFPSAWLGVGLVHVSPLGGSATLQREFVRGLRSRGWTGTLSVGTYLRAIEGEREVVQELAEQADLLFLNEAEARALFGGTPPPGCRVFETRGAAGAWVHADGRSRHCPAPQVEVQDPTGAGDAFCGGCLGRVSLGQDDAPAGGLALAARVLQGWGVEPLLDALPGEPPAHAEIHRPTPGLVEVDEARVGRVAARLRGVAQASALDFCGFPFPEAGAPRAAACLAVATLHQYGFWTADAAGYTGAMYAQAEGRRFKGSDFIWQAFTRAVRADPSVVDPERLATEPLLFDRVCRDDSGRCPVPDVGSHRALQQGWGRALLQRGGLDTMLDAANAHPRPIATLLEALATLPGYREDPLAKKAMLLAVVLGNRPERFLRAVDRDSLGPIVDYHIMRGCLRTGCVRIHDDGLRQRLEARSWVESGQEAAVREATLEAMGRLCERSGLGVDAVDGFFFVNGRTRCLEGEAPHCSPCPVREDCARHEELFQPIFRTTSY